MNATTQPHLAPMLLIGVVYPLTGLTMVAALAVELATGKRRGAR